MTPLFQGKIDNFCAAYAVLNALRLIHGISDFQARSLFSALLLRQSRDEKMFRAILEHTTDYQELVDDFFRQAGEYFSLRVKAPFGEDTGCDEVWEALRDYACPERGRSAVFRFRRYEAFRVRPCADHWTTGHKMEGNELLLFDCSLEPEGLYRLTRPLLKDDVDERMTEYVIIPPSCVRLIERGTSEGGACGGSLKWQY